MNMNFLGILWQQWPSLSSIPSRVEPIDYSSAAIKGHRSTGSRYIRYEMKVCYVSSTGARVDRWEPEGFVQLGAPELLYRYWESVGGRKCDEHWYPLRVMGDITKPKGGKLLVVLWEGSPEMSEEPYKRMIRKFPELVRHYEGQKMTNADFSDAHSPHLRRQRTAVKGKGRRGGGRKRVKQLSRTGSKKAGAKSTLGM
ncbi:hypothetical protein CGMCC3_g17236 [Colletotrichum fructicola]|uniref:Chromo domain-containing protein n=1 Tax=Colletotrichum fructicola (strain Nara gc5) TaxID=1213859 RepID=A0A7J6IDH1_COLFN|nr:uncharacterized protein CGMCC3_g17236 [Colletotrichum fructicola]KAE9566610.1 hypothetical protein CGMCC3_g17236 [Colletotrichum fructicola]KAF4473864.1 hypothetical protein CGGC5_v016887 [Colletotrichum fructicola Nara gc5]